MHALRPVQLDPVDEVARSAAAGWPANHREAEVERCGRVRRTLGDEHELNVTQTGWKEEAFARAANAPLGTVSPA
jgi:hypothetical protein